MNKEQHYNIHALYTDEVLMSNLTKEEVEKFIVHEANSLNYGLYRYWQRDGKTFYDCGPLIYVVKVAE